VINIAHSVEKIAASFNGRTIDSDSVIAGAGGPRNFFRTRLYDAPTCAEKNPIKTVCSCHHHERNENLEAKAVKLQRWLDNWRQKTTEIKGRFCDSPGDPP
jgi:hypothetical protein